MTNFLLNVYMYYSSLQLAQRFFAGVALGVFLVFFIFITIISHGLVLVALLFGISIAVSIFTLADFAYDYDTREREIRRNQEGDE